MLKSEGPQEQLDPTGLDSTLHTHTTDLGGPERGGEGEGESVSTDLSSLVKVQPVPFEVLDDCVAEAGVVLIVEYGEVLQQVCDDDVQQEDGDEDVVGDEPENSSHSASTVSVQFRAVVVANLERNTV